MHKTFWLLLLFVVAFMQPVYADAAQPCDGETIQAIAAWAGVKGKLASAYKDPPGGLIAAAACKKMPNAPGTTIAAIAFDTGRVSEDKFSMLLKVIALVEADKVVAAHRSDITEYQNFVLSPDAYRIDTARYILSKDVRAFGVVFDLEALGMNCYDGGSGRNLTLWIREGENLRAVFGINLYGWNHLEGENFCAPVSWDTEEPGKTESAEITIAIEKTSSHGFADLAITAHVKQNFCQQKNCSITGKRTVRKVVKYDGQSYRGIDDRYDFWWRSSVHNPHGE